MAMTLRLTYEEADALREFARRQGRSMQEVACTAIREYITRRTERRDAHLTAIVSGDSELLRRLSR